MQLYNKLIIKIRTQARVAAAETARRGGIQRPYESRIYKNE